MTGPRLLLDENLSPRLVGRLADEFPESVHVEGAGLQGRTDAEVWAYARDHGYMLVSKDNDFRQLSFLHGAPPKVVWLRIGNAPTQAVADLLLARRADVMSFAQDAETALLVLQAERDHP